MSISHVKSNTIADFTGTVTAFNSAGVSTTQVASAMVRPSDWNSAHAMDMTLGGNTAGQSTLSGTNIELHGGNNVTLSGIGSTIIISALLGLTTAAQSAHSHGNPTLALTNISGTTASASNGLTLSLSAAAPAAGVAVSAGGSSVSAGTLVFSNSNGVSFGANGSTITASHNGVTSQTVQTQGSVAVQGSTGAISFANSNGITFGGNASTLTASHNGLTSQSNQAVSAGNGSSAFQTLSFADGSGVSWSTVAGGLGATVKTDYASSNHSHGNPTLALTNLTGTTASNSAGLTISLSAAAAGGAGGPAISAAGSSQSAGTLVFSNSNGVSFGMNGSTITATVTPGAAAGLAAGQAGTQTATSGTLVFANSNGLTFGMSGSSQVTASHNGITQQSTQPVAVSGSNGSYAFSTLSFSNANGASFGTSAGSALTMSYTVPTVTNSSWTVSDAASSATVGRLAFTNLNGVTLSLSTGAAGNHTIVGSHNAITSQTAQTQSNVQGLIVSNTTYRTGDVSFSNANGISFGSSAGQAVTASYTVPSTAGLLSAINVSGGTTSNNLSAIVFSNSNGVSFGLNGSTMTGSHNGITSQSVQTQSNVQGISAGTQVGRTGDIVFSNSNGITFGMSGSTQITASYNSTQFAGTGTSITGNALITLDSAGLKFNGTSLAGVSTGFTGANLSASMTMNSSGFALSMSAQAPGAATLTAYAVSNTTQSTSGTIQGSVLSFQGAGGVSMGISNGSVVVSGPALTSLAISGALSASSNGSTISLGVGTVTANVASNTTQASTGTIDLGNLAIQARGGLSAGISNGSIVISGGAGGGGAGISAGTQSVSTGTVVFSNSNGITFGMSGSSQVTASYNSTQFAGTGTTFAGANASGSMTLNSAGLNLSISVAAPGAAAEANAHNLLGNNTVGNTTATGSTIGLSGLNLTLSGTNGSQIVLSAPATSSLVGASGLSVSTNGSTITVYPGIALSRFYWEPPGASSAGSAMTQGSMSFQQVVVPANLNLSRVDVPVQISLASSAAANTGNLLISSGLVIYTASGSTLNPIVGAFGTTTYTHASNTANFNSITGPRMLSFPISTLLTPGLYFVGVQLSTNNNSSIGTATTALAATISLQHGALYTASAWAEFGAVTNGSINMRSFMGVAASVTATGQTQQLSNITQTGTALMRANIPVNFRNV